MTLFNDGVLPVKIRERVTVGIANLPHDLTKIEADKICRVILAHVEETLSNDEAPQ